MLELNQIKSNVMYGGHLLENRTILSISIKTLQYDPDQIKDVSDFDMTSHLEILWLLLIMIC